MIRYFLLMVSIALLTSTSWCVTAEVCIDPGHGGSDPGATSGSGGTESVNVLNTANKFKTWMNSDTSDSGGGGSWAVVMTRTSDVYVSLQGRCDVANNNASNYFMCIHNNAFDSSAHGTETYCYGSGSAASIDLRNKVQYRMLNAWGLTNRGNKTANYYVLVNTNMPAELAELGFIDASPDYNYVDSSTHQNSAGLAHLYAIQTRCGLSAYEPGQAVTYIDDSPTASSNWTTNSSAADKYGADYKYRATAAISDPAEWAMNTSGTGQYDVYAWWSAASNRSTSAPYILPDNTTKNVNQQANGGKWNLLGTNQFNVSGTHYVKLSCWTTTGYFVIADAVKLVGPK